MTQSTRRTLRRAYRSPVLRLHGDVVEVTRAVNRGAGALDGMGGMGNLFKTS